MVYIAIVETKSNFKYTNQKNTLIRRWPPIGIHRVPSAIYLRGTPPLKTYLPNQITLKLSTYFKSRVPKWDSFFSKKNSKSCVFRLLRAKTCWRQHFFPLHITQKPLKPMTLKFLHKLNTINTEGFTKGNFDIFYLSYWNIQIFDRFSQNAKILEKFHAKKWP